MYILKETYTPLHPLLWPKRYSNIFWLLLQIARDAKSKNYFPDPYHHLHKVKARTNDPGSEIQQTHILKATLMRLMIQMNPSVDMREGPIIILSVPMKNLFPLAHSTGNLRTRNEIQMRSCLIMMMKNRWSSWRRLRRCRAVDADTRAIWGDFLESNHKLAKDRGKPEPRIQRPIKEYSQRLQQERLKTSAREDSEARVEIGFNQTLKPTKTQRWQVSVSELWILQNLRSSQMGKLLPESCYCEEICRELNEMPPSCQKASRNIWSLFPLIWSKVGRAAEKRDDVQCLTRILPMKFFYMDNQWKKKNPQSKKNRGTIIFFVSTCLCVYQRIDVLAREKEGCNTHSSCLPIWSWRSLFGEFVFTRFVGALSAPLSEPLASV